MPITAQSPRPPSRAMVRWLYCGVAAGGLAADAAAKALAVRHLDPEHPVRLLSGLLTLQLTRNAGAAFSFGESYTFVFALLALVVLAGVVILLLRRVRHIGWAVAFGLLSAGVAGNAADRLFREPGFLHGHVVDFLQLPHWAIFNVADICITSAAILIIILSLIKNIGLDGVRHPARPSQTRSEPQPDSARSPAASAEESGDQALATEGVASHAVAAENELPKDAGAQ